MSFNNYIDKCIIARGYDKSGETKYGAYYTKAEDEGFTHVICILHKANHKHLIQSYDKETLAIDNKFVNEGCGIELKDLILFWFKYKAISKKYHWNSDKFAKI